MSEYTDFWDAHAQIGVFIEEVYQEHWLARRFEPLAETRASELLLSDGDSMLDAPSLPLPETKIALPPWGENVKIS